MRFPIDELIEAILLELEGADEVESAYPTSAEAIANARDKRETRETATSIDNLQKNRESPTRVDPLNNPFMSGYCGSDYRCAVKNSYQLIR